jgi:hypothetical protein
LANITRRDQKNIGFCGIIKGETMKIMEATVVVQILVDDNFDINKQTMKKVEPKYGKLIAFETTDVETCEE